MGRFACVRLCVYGFCGWECLETAAVAPHTRLLVDSLPSIPLYTHTTGGVKDIRKLGGSLDEWIPPGYDVYCVGVQVRLCVVLAGEVGV